LLTGSEALSVSVCSALLAAMVSKSFWVEFAAQAGGGNAEKSRGMGTYDDLCFFDDF